MVASAWSWDTVTGHAQQPTAKELIDRTMRDAESDREAPAGKAALASARSAGLARSSPIARAV